MKVSKMLLRGVFTGAMMAGAAVQAAVTVEPITWNVIGLDSNKPATIQPAPSVYPPDRFPFGVEVCANGAAVTSHKAVFVWDETPSPNYFHLWDSSVNWNDTDGSSNPITANDGEAPSELAIPDLADGSCTDVYFWIQIEQVAAAYEYSRDFHLEIQDGSSTKVAELPHAAATLSGVAQESREAIAERLVSQNRNAIEGFVYNGSAVAVDGSGSGSIDVATGQTFELTLVGSTATQGYEQLEAFLTLPPDLFRVNSVTATYSAKAGTDPSAGKQLYADGCGWVNNPDSPDYVTEGPTDVCTSVGKYGGDIEKTYNITVLAAAAGGSFSSQALIYDFSGSSFHYNADYESATLTFNWITNSNPYDLAVSKTAVDNGGSGNGTYTITVDVKELAGGTPIVGGADITEPVVVGDYLPDGYNVKSNPNIAGNITVSDGSYQLCTSKGIGCVAPASASDLHRYVEWTIPSGTLGSSYLSADMEINFVSSGIASADSQDFINCARLDSAPLDNFSPNNEACVFFAFAPAIPVDLSVRKTVKAYDPVTRKVTFELVVTNESGGALSADVYVQDALPAGYDYVLSQTVSVPATVAGNFSPPPSNNSSYEYLSFTFNDTPANEVAGASVTIEFDAVALVPAVGATDEEVVGDYTNVVGLLEELAPTAVPLTDDDTTNNQASAAFIPPLLTIVKGADGTLTGSTYPYTLTVSRVGSFSAGDVITVTEAPPPDATISAISSADPEWSCSVASGTEPAKCTRTVAASGEPSVYGDIDVVAAFSPLPSVSTTLINTAFVEATRGSEVIANTYDEDVASIDYTVNADIALEKVVSDATPNVGDSVTFTLTVRNGGPSAATNIDVVDLLPSGYTYDASTIAGGDSRDDSAAIAGGVKPLSWIIDSLASGGSAVLTFDATVLSSGVYLNTAEVTDVDQTDPDSTPDNDDGDQSEDDEDNAGVTPKIINLSLMKAVSQTAVQTGTDVTYTLTLHNAGPDTATGVVVTDVLPAGLTYSTGSIAGGSSRTYTAGTNAAEWGVASLASGSSVNLSFVATVDAVGVITNTAEVTAANEYDSNSTPNNGAVSEDDQDSVDVSGATAAPPTADLAVTKTNGEASVATGDATVYRVLVTNNGPSAVTGALLTDVAATGLNKTAVACSANSPGQCSSAPSIGQLEAGFALPALASGQSYALDVTATVTSTSGNVINVAVVAPPAGVNDSNPGNNTASDDDPVQNIYDPPYGVKTGTLENGNTQIRWTMVWQNGTGVAVPDVTITDDTTAYPGWSYMGPVTCTGNGATTVISCSESAGMITVDASFGADENVDTLEISFLASIDDPNQGAYDNQAESTCTSCGGTTKQSDDNNPTENDPTRVVIPVAATPVPVAPWQVMGLMILMLSWMGYAARRRRA